MIRDAVEQYLHADREAEIDRQLVEAYTRIPDSADDAWGDLDVWRDALAIERGRSRRRSALPGARRGPVGPG